MDDLIQAKRFVQVIDTGCGLPKLVVDDNNGRLFEEEMGAERMLFLAEQLTGAARRLISGMSGRSG